MADTVNELNKQLDNVLRPLFDNKIFVGILGLFLAVYAGWLAPALPNSVIGFFDTAIGKLLFIFVIAFVASRDVPNSFQVALIVSIIFLVTLTVLNNLKMKEAFRNIGAEHFGLMEQMRGLMGNNGLMEHAEGDMPLAPNSDVSGQAPAGQAPAGQASAGQAPAGQAPAGQSNMANQPAGQSNMAVSGATPSTEPVPMSCDDVLNRCYTDFTPEQQQQVCSGAFEEPKDNAMELPLSNNFQQTGCGGYIRQCMTQPNNASINNVSNKKVLNMRPTSCPVPANK
jgi:hypothetical protein